MTDSIERFATPYRTHTCGQLRIADAGREARLAGWVHRRRDHGQLIFLDLRDRYGLTQVVVDATESPLAHAAASRLRNEFVISVTGTVAARLPGSENPRMATGAIELRASQVDLLAEAKTPPFYINEPDAPIDEALRLRYRYLDIRREPMQQRLLLRSRLVHAIREVHHEQGFVEIETPNLIRSTPEGARDFIVPSRLKPGTVYALPQSPQQLKQLLMVGGIDRYFQIARCFRDEDARGDRQPEFTQLDLEMSFVDEATVIGFVEDLVIRVTRTVVPDRPLLQVPFPRFTFAEAIERFGSDKPDIRFGMELVDLAPRAGRCGWQPRVRLPGLRRHARRRRPGEGDRRARDGDGQPVADRRADRARPGLRGQGPGLAGGGGRRHRPLADRQVPGRGGRRVGHRPGRRDPRRPGPGRGRHGRA